MACIPIVGETRIYNRVYCSSMCRHIYSLTESVWPTKLNSFCILWSCYVLTRVLTFQCHTHTKAFNPEDRGSTFLITIKLHGAKNSKTTIWTTPTTRPNNLHYSTFRELLSSRMSHTQKPDFVFCQNRQVHLNWWGRQFSRLLAVEECGSAGSDFIIFSKYVDHSLKMSLQGGKKWVKRSGEL